MVIGPDTTTTCGDPSALLKINEQYVVGVGSICQPISAWSTLQSYSANELRTLRAFSRDFEAGNLMCADFPEPVFTTTATTSTVVETLSSLTLIISSIALVFMITLFIDNF